MQHSGVNTHAHMHTDVADKSDFEKPDVQLAHIWFKIGSEGNHVSF